MMCYCIAHAATFAYEQPLCGFRRRQPADGIVFGHLSTEPER